MAQRRAGSQVARGRSAVAGASIPDMIRTHAGSMELMHQFWACGSGQSAAHGHFVRCGVAGLQGRRRVGASWVGASWVASHPRYRPSEGLFHHWSESSHGELQVKQVDVCVDVDVKSSQFMCSVDVKSNQFMSHGLPAPIPAQCPCFALPLCSTTLLCQLHSSCTAELFFVTSGLMPRLPARS